MAVKEDVFADLQREMRACRACLDAGHWVEPPAVTQGDVDARMMTIGQAPGITEVEVGRPFERVKNVNEMRLARPRARQLQGDGTRPRLIDRNRSKPFRAWAGSPARPH